MLGKVTLSLACLVLLAVVQARRIDEHRAFNFTSFGDSGVRCTRQGRRCIDTATCTNNRCFCPPGQRGPAEIECFEKGERLCYISGDPHINGFGHARADVALPCRFRATRFVTDNSEAVTDHGSCAIEVFATNQEHFGRYAVRSVHVSVGVTDPVTQIQTASEIYKEMKDYNVNDTNMVYRYEGHSLHNDNIWGSGSDVTVDLLIHPTLDSVNNFAVLDVPTCGVRVKYRAFDPRRVRGQKQMPGLTIQAPVHAEWVNGFGSYPEGICGKPDDTRFLYQTRATDLSLNDDSTAIIYDILKEAPSQKDNRNAAQCEKAFDLFATSANQVDAVNTCAFVLNRPSVNRCVSDKVAPAMDVFNGCLAHQQGDPFNCAAYKNAAERCGAEPDWTGQDSASIICA